MAGFQFFANHSDDILNLLKHSGDWLTNIPGNLKGFGTQVLDAHNQLPKDAAGWVIDHLVKTPPKPNGNSMDAAAQIKDLLHPGRIADLKQIWGDIATHASNGAEAIAGTLLGGRLLKGVWKSGVDSAVDRAVVRGAQKTALGANMPAAFNFARFLDSALGWIPGIKPIINKIAQIGAKEKMGLNVLSEAANQPFLQKMGGADKVKQLQSNMASMYGNIKLGY